MLAQRWANHAINFIYVSEILLMLPQYWGNDVLSLENKQNYFIFMRCWPNVGPTLKKYSKYAYLYDVGPTLTIRFCLIEKMAMQPLIEHQQDKSF